MSARKRRDKLPRDLERTRRRFERWRRTRKKRSAIPGTLWSAAAKMAKRYGINRTARTLRVSYYSLKERSEDEVSSFLEEPGDGKPTFFELAAGEAVCRCECTLELEDAGGARMRVHVKGVEAPDLAALTRSFREAEP